MTSSSDSRNNSTKNQMVKATPFVSFSTEDIPGSSDKKMIVSVDNSGGQFNCKELMICSLALGKFFRDDFLLLSTDDNENLSSAEKLAQLESISKENNRKPILIKQNNQITVYGNSGGLEWKFTQLDSNTAFNQLQFPAEHNQAVPVSKGTVTPDMYAELNAKNAHTFVFEQRLEYSKDTQTWSAAIAMPVPPDLRERFAFMSNVTPDSDLFKDKIPAYQKAHMATLALEAGKPHPFIYPSTQTQQGNLERFIYSSDGSLTGPVPASQQPKDNERIIKVYTPAGYDKDRKPAYNLQITLDGDDMNFSALQPNVVLDNLIAAGKMVPTIVAFVPFCDGNLAFDDASNMRFKEYSCNSQVAQRLAGLPDALRDLNYNANTDREHVSITGISLSAQQAAYTALLYPDVFGSVIAQSPAVWWSPLKRILLLPEGALLPEKISDDAILMKLVGNQVSIYSMKDGELIRNKVYNEDNQIQLAEISCVFPREGNTPKEITLQINQELFDKLTMRYNVSGPWAMPANDRHEYLRDLVAISPSCTMPIQWYFQAGDLELGKGDGMGALKPATDRLANILQQKGHHILANEVYRGDHDYPAWQCDIVKAERAVNPSVRREKAVVADTEMASTAVWIKERTVRQNAKEQEQANENDNASTYSSPTPFSTNLTRKR